MTKLEILRVALNKRSKEELVEIGIMGMLAAGHCDLLGLAASLVEFGFDATTANKVVLAVGLETERLLREQRRRDVDSN
jgi:hypothetical protein